MPLNQPGVKAASSGTYTGDDTADRAIPHGLPGTPKLVTITNDTNPAYWYRIHAALAFIFQRSSTLGGKSGAVTAMDSTNFYVGNAANYTLSANLLNDVHRWVAFG